MLKFWLLVALRLGVNSLSYVFLGALVNCSSIKYEKKLYPRDLKADIENQFLAEIR
jgi:hypothetical protein